MSVTLNGSNGITFNDGSSQTAAASPLGLKNRIINGDMRIDQRNAGASVSTSAAAVIYTLDRWAYYASQASKFTIQQNAASVTPPAGFTNYLGVTSSSAYSIVSSDIFEIRQAIEAYNTSDLVWGTANAKTITLSFWVRSSLTGTFGGALTGNDGTSYPYTYTISSANTWEQKTITIAGPTIGTWQTTNGLGILVRFGLGSGSTYSGTAGSWSSTVYSSATGATSVVGTNGATFYITGVQLEIGTSATPFERRQYGQELALCQRYYYKWTNDNAGAVDATVFQNYASGSSFGKLFDFPVTMRATPTGTASGTFKPYNASGTAQAAFSSTNVDSLTKQSAGAGAWTGSSGLTAGNATGIQVAANGFVAVSAEL
jgi:hypothetical protein